MEWCGSVILPPCFYQARFCTETYSDVAEWCSESKKLMHCCIIRWSLRPSSVLFLQIVILSTLAIALECLLRWDSTAISLVFQPIDAIDALCILLRRGVGRVSTRVVCSEDRLSTNWCIALCVEVAWEAITWDARCNEMHWLVIVERQTYKYKNKNTKVETNT